MITDPRDLGEPPALVAPPADPDGGRPADRAPAAPDEARGVELEKGRNIVPPPPVPPLAETIEGRVLIVVPDDVSTGDMAPDGALGLAIWSNIPACARYMFRRFDPEFPARAEEWGGGIVVGGHNYGQGSSREQAAFAALHLGVRAIVAKSFARIHRTNLIAQGIPPLTFAVEADYERVAQGDEWTIPGVRDAVRSGRSELEARTRRSGCARARADRARAGDPARRRSGRPRRAREPEPPRRPRRLRARPRARGGTSPTPARSRSRSRRLRGRPRDRGSVHDRALRHASRAADPRRQGERQVRSAARRAARARRDRRLQRHVADRARHRADARDAGADRRRHRARASSPAAPTCAAQGGSPFAQGLFGGVGLAGGGFALAVVPPVEDWIGWRAPFATSLCRRRSRGSSCSRRAPATEPGPPARRVHLAARGSCATRGSTRSPSSTPPRSA